MAGPSVIPDTDGSIKVTLDAGAVQAMLSDPSHMTGQFLFRLGNRITNTARANFVGRYYKDPIDTGRLRSSVTMAVESKPPADCVLAIGSDVEYARYVHDGTRYMAARPFLADAVRTELSGL